MQRMLRKVAVAAVVIGVLSSAAAVSGAIPATTNLVGRLRVNAQTLRDGTTRVTYQLETTSGTYRLPHPGAADRHAEDAARDPQEPERERKRVCASGGARA